MQLRVTVYTPESPLRRPGPFLAGMFSDLLSCHQLAWPLFVRDFTAQYRQTMLGYVWAFLPPLAAAATFIFLQSQGIVQASATAVPYAAFAIIGTTLWQTFVDAIQSPSTSVLNAKVMLSKVNFPREAVLIAGLYMVIFNCLIRLILLAGAMAIWHIVPGPGIWLFPLAVAGLLVCGTAAGMMLLPVGSLYGDISRSIPIVTQFWMLLTPVVYPARTFGLAGWVASWNPIAPVVTTARESLIDVPFTQLNEFLIVSLISLVLCFLGLVAFRLVMPLLIERMGG